MLTGHETTEITWRSSRVAVGVGLIRLHDFHYRARPGPRSSTLIWFVVTVVMSTFSVL